MMKILLVLVLLLMNLSTSHAQTESAIFTLDSNGIISTNNEMIDPFDLTGCDIDTLIYTPKNPVQFLVGNSAITVKTGVFEDWNEGAEKSGFNVISIYRNGDKVFDLKQTEMWAYTYAGQCTYDYRKYTDNRYFVPVKLSNKSTALFFVGWPYGGDLPYLTIIKTESWRFSKEPRMSN